MSSPPDSIHTDKARRLGRGLEALLGERSAAAPFPTASGPVDIPLSDLRPNPYQPRRDFSEENLAELQASLKANGLLQPISVRQIGTEYQIVAGERRYRAAERLGWATIPAIVRPYDDRAMLTLALIENLQRADLNAMEEADGLFHLMSEFHLTQQEVAEAVGKDRSTVANLLRIRQLPDDVRDLVRLGTLSAGHARALLSLPPTLSASDVAKDIVRHHLSVRAVEQLSHKRTNASVSPRGSGQRDPSVSSSNSAEARRIADRLRRYLQTDVSVLANAQATGELRIRFYSADDLERLLGLMIHQTEES